jgi:hypothetical protein
MKAQTANSKSRENRPLWENIPGLGNCVDGAPMHLLTRRGLVEAFISVVQERKRDGGSVVTTRKGGQECAIIPACDLADEVREAHQLVVNLSIEIDQYRAEYAAKTFSNTPLLNQFT